VYNKAKVKRKSAYLAGHNITTQNCATALFD
jgi:hypothetical protein